MSNNFPRREFYMARHGEIDDNVNKVVSGENGQLTIKGQQQALQLGEVFNTLFEGKRKACYVVSAELDRAQDTCCGMTGDKDFIVDARLNERKAGPYGGRMSSKRWNIIRKDPANYEARLNARGAQTDMQHAPQVIEAVNEHLTTCPPEKIPVFVAHSGTLRQTAYAAGVSTNFENAVLYHFVPDEHSSKWSVTKVTKQNGRIIEEPVIIVPPPYPTTPSASVMVPR